LRDRRTAKRRFGLARRFRKRSRSCRWMSESKRGFFQKAWAGSREVRFSPAAPSSSRGWPRAASISTRLGPELAFVAKVRLRLASQRWPMHVASHFECPRKTGPIKTVADLQGKTVSVSDRRIANGMARSRFVAPARLGVETESRRCRLERMLRKFPHSRRHSSRRRCDRHRAALQAGGGRRHANSRPVW